MNNKILGVGVCIIFVLFCRYAAIGAGDTSTDGQAVSDEQSPVIRVSSNLVTVPVSVTDPEGHAIRNLGLRDFLIREDGRPETVSRLAEAGQSPLRLALLFDLSGSLNARFGFEQEAAIHFLDKVWTEGDTVAIVTFTDVPQIRLQASDSLSAATTALSSFEPTEKPTAFFDAVVLSAQALRRSAGPETRRAIIALSDGEDNRSHHSLSEALSEVQHADTIFYSINPSGASIRLNEISLKAQSDLSKLAGKTGGSAFLSDRMIDLDEIFLRIAAELRAQYLLSYYSTNSRIDGTYRRISVSIPGRDDLHIRTRQGYYASLK
jgi:Ca-activated chloride channel family protein